MPCLQEHRTFKALIGVRIRFQLFIPRRTCRFQRLIRMRQLFRRKLRILRNRMMQMKVQIKIGTRGSKLALWQAEWVKSRIEAFFPEVAPVILPIKTMGDRVVDRPLSMVGGKGLFVKEIEQALLDREIDLAVHSMKDMPGSLPGGLIIGAIPVRENPFDAVVSGSGQKLAELTPGSIVGTSSLRRSSQLKHARPDLTIQSIRGNLDTRLGKLDSGEFNAILLAAAGLIRLEMEHVITEYLPEETMVPAAGQGALCIETRENDNFINSMMEKLNHPDTEKCVTGERAFLQQIEGSCHVPVGCFGRIISEQSIRFTGIVSSEDGKTVIKESVESGPDETRTAGIELADLLLDKGAKTILENISSND